MEGLNHIWSKILNQSKSGDGGGGHGLVGRIVCGVIYGRYTCSISEMRPSAFAWIQKKNESTERNRMDIGLQNIGS